MTMAPVRWICSAVLCLPCLLEFVAVAVAVATTRIQLIHYTWVSLLEIVHISCGNVFGSLYICGFVQPDPSDTTYWTTSHHPGSVGLSLISPLPCWCCCYMTKVVNADNDIASFGVLSPCTTTVCDRQLCLFGYQEDSLARTPSGGEGVPTAAQI
jgi:hypothetical protein